MNKSYQVFYWIKKNCHEYLHHIFVNAPNTKEACKIAKQVVKEQIGRNAFRPTTKAPTPEQLEKWSNMGYYIVD